MTRVLVCGGRDFDDIGSVYGTMDSLHESRRISTIITGAQRKWCRTRMRWIGADWLAIEWALRREIPFIGHPAKWDAYGKSAGPRRNEQMPAWWSPTTVVAFPGGAGTAGMISIARGLGLEVIEVPARSFLQETP